MSNPIQAVRGMRDIHPEETPRWVRLEGIARRVLDAYGYREVRLPLLEKTELFRRSIGEVTDIVEKEMYTFEDRNGESLTLRPEGTAGCVRAGIQHGWFRQPGRRLWYLGPMFRHERPQQGRYRQFHQIGVEAYGMPGPDIDAELILLGARLWRELGVEDVRLELNTLGDPADRSAYRRRLVEYFEARHDALDEDSRRRLHGNPLRILDSKNPAMQGLIEDAPRLGEHVGAECRAHFEVLQEALREAGVDFIVNPRLVRGLDYYNRTVFEWVTDRLGAQGTVCAGGRYDGLVEQLGGRATPAVGFAMGLERLLALLGDAWGGERTDADVYLVMVGEAAERAGPVLAERLRSALPRLRLLVHCGGGGFKSQFKRADRSGARLALVLGEEEARTGRVSVKPLREAGEQSVLGQSELADYLAKTLYSSAAK